MVDAKNYAYFVEVEIVHDYFNLRSEQLVIFDLGFRIENSPYIKRGNVNY